MAEWKGPTGEKGIRRAIINGQRRFILQMGGRGKGKRRAKVCATLDEAIQIKRRWEREGMPAPGDKRPARDEPEATVDEGLRHYVLDLESRRKDGRRAEQVRDALRAVLPHASIRPLTVPPELLLADLAAFVAARQTAGIRNNTIVRDLRVLRAMFKKARPDLRIPAELFPPENLTRVRMLSPAQQAEVFPMLGLMAGERFELLTRLALLGILRLNDVRTLTRGMVHLDARMILLPRTKGDKPRLVRLNAEAVEVLTRALLISPHPTLVFPNAQSGKPYSRVHISRCWRRAARACGLDGFTFHDLRHHGPTVAVNAGVNDATIQAMGGWANASSMKRYTHVLNPAVDQAMNLITTRPPGA